MNTRPFLDLHKVFDLDALTDDEFKVVVDADLRRHSVSERSLMPERLADELRSPQHRERWLSILLRMEANIQSQLDVRATDHEAALAELRLNHLAAGGVPDNARISVQIETLRTEYLRKRATALRFKGGLDATLIEAQHLVAELGSDFESVAAEERDHFKTRSRKLESAIATHQALTEANEIPANDIDRTLWASIT